MRTVLPAFIRRALLLALSTVVASAMASDSADRIVVSGFEPFGGRSENASWTLAQEIKKAFPSILNRQVPVVWGAPLKAIAAETMAPDVWIAFGEGTPKFKIEVLAHNQRGRFPDNEGLPPSTPNVIAEGPAEMKNTVDAAKLAAKLSAAGFPTSESTNAGHYLCEEMLYSLLHAQKENPKGFRLVLFIHLPVLDKPVTSSGESGQQPVSAKVDAKYLAAFGKQLITSLQEMKLITLPSPATRQP